MFIYLLTIPTQNKLSCCENIGTDHKLEALQCENFFPKLLKGKYGYHLGEFSNTSFVVFEIV